MIPFNKFDPLWRPLTPEQRKLWTPEQIEVYDTYTWRNAVRRSPADFARAVSPDRWLDLPHSLYVSGIISDFINDRLISPSGKIATRLFLTMPPRHGKSFLLSEHVPAYFLSLFPDQQVILTTYEANFAAKWGAKVRDIMEAHGEKFGLGLSNSSQAKSRWGLAKPYLGGMITAGMGGPITGEGGGLLIGDDWVKNSEEANSEAWRETAWDWFNTTFKTRAQKDLRDKNAPQPKMLLLMTRWHDDDPMGRLLKNADSQGSLVIVHLPALAGADDPLGRAEGEALCPQIMSSDELLELKREDKPSFNALYQGDPTPDEGGLFSKSNFRYWGYSTADLTDAYVLRTPEGTQIPVPVKDCRHFITVDLAISKKNWADYSVFCLWALTPERDLLLLSRFRERIEEADHLPCLQRFYEEGELTLKAAGAGGIRLVGIEKQTYGLTLLSGARRTTGMPVHELEADADKYARAIPAAALVKGGKFYLPEHADWTEDWISECVLFPTGKHDDMVDTFAYAARLMSTTFRHINARKKGEDENGEEGRISSHIEKIAKRNAKVRRQRGRM